MYSLPSSFDRPDSLTSFSDPILFKSSYLIISALIKPFSKSVCITEAALGALDPLFIVQARTSFSPPVKYVSKSNNLNAFLINKFKPGSSRLY